MKLRSGILLHMFRKPIFFLISSILVIGTFLSSFSYNSSPQKAEAYPAYAPNADLVKVAPYDPATTGASNWNGNNGFREFVTIGQKYRVRQNGTISQVRMYTVSKVSLTAFYIKIWRKNGSNYDLVGTSNNIINGLTNSTTTTIALTSPISGVQEGDYYGYRIEATSGGAFHADTGLTGVTTYYVNNVEPSASNYNWAGQTTSAGVALPIELYMQAPQVAFIGDSIIAGHPGHYSFLEATATTNVASTIEKQLGDLTGYTYQNMGIGSQTTTSIAARFSSDIVALKPRVVVIEGGVNDIAGAVSKSTFLANWTSMLDAAQNDLSISRIIVLKILPWTNGTNIQMQTRDDWNSSLETLAVAYGKAVVIDASSYVGQFRADGDPNNLWDIQAAYNADGVHFNQAGHGRIAQAIVDQGLPDDLVSPMLASLSPADNATEIDIDSNLVINFSENVVPRAGAQNDIVIKKSSDNSTVETFDALSAEITGAGTSIITINPSGYFLPNTDYYVEVGADAFDDMSDNGFAGFDNDATWNFRTVSNLVAGFNYRKAIAIDNANINGTLTDFPLYVRIAGDADIGRAVQNNGHDIQFVSSDILHFLPYERETWTGGGGNAASGEFWVKTTLNADLNSETDDTIYIYYGSSDTTDVQDLSNTWNSNYSGVWHLDEDVTDEETQADIHRDSTAFAHSGTQSGNTETMGKVSNAQDFDGIDDTISINQAYSSQDITVSWWSNCAIANPTSEGIFDINRGANDRLFAYHWDFSGNNGIYVTYYDTSTLTRHKKLLDVSITQSDWHYYSVSWTEATQTLTLYEDGVAQSTDGAGLPATPTGSATRLGIGHSTAPGDVSVDEFRISSLARPLPWLKFEYLNMSEGDNELFFGSQIDLYPSSPTPQSTVEPATDASNSIIPSTKEIIRSVSRYINTPLAAFISPSTHSFDAPFTFDASESFSTKGIVKYLWDFGDGTTSEEMKVDHQYQKPGRYTVTLTVTDKAGKTATKVQTVDANPPKPTMENIGVDGTNLIITGKAYPKTTVNLTIHSNTITDKSTVDENGAWTYKVANAKEALGTGDHTVYADTSYLLADNTELKSETSKTYDFKVSIDDGKLKVEMEKTKTRTWQYISLALIAVIIIGVIGFVLIRAKKRKIARPLGR